MTLTTATMSHRRLFSMLCAVGLTLGLVIGDASRSHASVACDKDDIIGTSHFYLSRAYHVDVNTVTCVRIWTQAEKQYPSGGSFWAARKYAYDSSSVIYNSTYIIGHDEGV